MIDSIKCKNCGKKIAQKTDEGILHFSFKMHHGKRFEFMTPVSNDNSTARCPGCGHWTGVWEMTTTPRVEFIGEIK